MKKALRIAAILAAAATMAVTASANIVVVPNKDGNGFDFKTDTAIPAESDFSVEGKLTTALQYEEEVPAGRGAGLGVGVINNATGALKFGTAIKGGVAADSVLFTVYVTSGDLSSFTAPTGSFIINGAAQTVTYQAPVVETTPPTAAPTVAPTEAPSVTAAPPVNNDTTPVTTDAPTVSQAPATDGGTTPSVPGATKTGVALALIPTALAAGAVGLSKKRK